MGRSAYGDARTSPNAGSLAALSLVVIVRLRLARSQAVVIVRALLGWRARTRHSRTTT